MTKLRRASDGDFWELDASTPRTLEGAARAVPGKALPLGLSRGTRLSRPNQIDFMQRYMAAPSLPSYTNHFGITLQRGLSIPFSENWSALLLGQFNMRKFLSSLRKMEELRCLCVTSNQPAGFFLTSPCMLLASPLRSY
ncbi:hypothetical protein V6N13_078922 [Hibiscus sabdariffa]|uniref:Uncharacterized protein n=1 Tax=Hibiscus sabdariffa TaxID=183260 RepID=A0ABR2RQ03_9ROSI